MPGTALGPENPASAEGFGIRMHLILPETHQRREVLGCLCGDH